MGRHILLMILSVLCADDIHHCYFSAYKEDNQLGSFLEEIRQVFKGELEHQTTLASNEERIKDIENDAADAMDDNPNSVSNAF